MIPNPAAGKNRSIALLAAISMTCAVLAWSLAAGASPAFDSDDFNAAGIDGSVWSQVDPVGGATFSTVGAGSGDAHLRITVPGGKNHMSYWDNEAARLLQSVPDADFTLEADFDSMPTAAFQDQGILVQADDDTYVRFSLYHDGTNQRAYVATIDGNVRKTFANQVLPTGSARKVRVVRAGDQWTLSSSADGTSWTRHSQFTWAIAVDQLGPFAGTYHIDPAAAPAHTVLVDYVFNAADPIVPEDGGGPGNVAPVANAGPDQSVVDADGNGSQSVTLNGSGSSDSDGTIQSWAWSEGATALGSGQTLAKSFAVGVHTVTLKVTDDDGATDTDTVKITVTAPGNVAPVANAGPDQSVVDADGNGSQSVTLNGSGSSDSDGTIQSWAWSEGATALGSGQTLAKSFAVGVHTVTLKVTDDDGATDTDTVKITVTAPGNVAPVANAGPDQSVVDADGNGSQSVTLNGSGSSDSDGTIQSWAWSEGATALGSGQTLAKSFAVGVHTVTLKVTDDDGATDTDTVKITVTAPASSGGPVSDDFNTSSLAPQWTTVNPLSDAGFANVGVGTSDARLQITVPAGADHDPWLPNEAPRVLQPVDDADFDFEVKFDSKPSARYQMQGIIVQASPTNYLRLGMYSNGSQLRAFAASLNGSGSVIADKAISISGGSAWLRVERNGNTWNYRVSANGTNWSTVATFDRTMAVSDVGMYAGNYGDGASAPGFTALVDYAFDPASPVVPEDGNGSGPIAPVANAGPDQSVQDVDDSGAESVTLDGSGSSDADGSIVSWAWSEGATALGSGETLTENFTVGVHAVTVTVTDDDGETDTDDVTITVVEADAPVPPVADAGVDQSAVDADDSGAESVTLDGSGSSDADGVIVSWAWSEGATALGSGETLAENFTVGVHDVTLTVTDDDGETDTDNVTITVTAPTLVPPVADAGPDRSVQDVDDSGAESVTLDGSGSSDADGSIVSWAWSEGATALGSGQTLAKSFAVGVHDVTLVVTDDDGLTSSDIVRITVTAPASSGGPVSDDFNTSSLAPQWTTVNPLSDAGFANVGVGTSDARLQITVPAGASHDPWLPNEAPRVLQPVDDADFDFEVKFDSKPSARYQMQGIIVQASPTNYLRLGMYSNGSQLRAFAASLNGSGSVIADKAISIPGGSAWLRVERNGSNFSYQTSANGSSWSTVASFSNTMAVSDVGMYAGNYGAGGTAPGFTALVDYTFDPASPVVPEDGNGSGPIAPVANAGPDQSVVDADGNGSQSVTLDGSGSSDADGSIVSWAWSEGATTLGSGETLAKNFTVGVHAVTLTVTDDDGETDTDDVTITVDPPAAASGISDDFYRANLDPGRWQFVNPIGDGSVSMSGAGGDATVDLAVPAGTNHNLWSSNDSVRIERAIADEDASYQVGFKSIPSQSAQIQGLLIEQDGNDWLRFDVYSNGTSVRAFAANVVGGSPTAKIDTPLAGSGTTLHVRVDRVGTTWTMSYSWNGSAWSTAGSFTRALTANTIGVYAGNYSSGSAPSYTARVDYVFDNASPISPEDGTLESDSWSPFIHTVSAATSPSAATIGWYTDEAATTRVDYGETTSYELGSVTVSGLTKSHSAAIPGLSNATTYHYRVTSVDAGGRSSVSNDATFVTSPGSGNGPTIDIWYGNSQTAGAIGNPQRWVDVLGNVSDSNGVAGISYTLNGGAAQPMGLGPSTRRLAQPGDFVIELDRAALQPGSNLVEITAVDGVGNSTVKQVTVNYSAGNTWPLPFSTDFGQNGLDDVHVVDGRWAVQGDKVRPTVEAYDRLLALGDRTWTDYEVEVPFTVTHLDPGGYAYPSNGPAIGFVLRWDGHTGNGGAWACPQPSGSSICQPHQAWYPSGAVAAYQWKTGSQGAWMTGNNGTPSVNDYSGSTIDLNTEFVMKARVQTLGNGNTQYSYKFWEAGTPEPSGWNLSVTNDQPGDPTSGSILFLAHHIDVQVGDFVVTPL